MPYTQSIFHEVAWIILVWAFAEFLSDKNRKAKIRQGFQPHHKTKGKMRTMRKSK